MARPPIRHSPSPRKPDPKRSAEPTWRDDPQLLAKREWFDRLRAREVEAYQRLTWQKRVWLALRDWQVAKGQLRKRRELRERGRQDMREQARVITEACQTLEHAIDRSDTLVGDGQARTRAAVLIKEVQAIFQRAINSYSVILQPTPLKAGPGRPQDTFWRTCLQIRKDHPGLSLEDLTRFVSGDVWDRLDGTDRRGLFGRKICVQSSPRIRRQLIRDRLSLRRNRVE